MILYNQNYEMIGISSEGLSLFGFLTPEDFFRSCNDVSDYFLETSPLYNTKKHYIDLIISESQSNIQDMQIKLDNGDIMSAKIAVEVVNLKDLNEHYYSVKLLFDGNRLSYFSDQTRWLWDILYISRLDANEFKTRVLEFTKIAKERYEALYEAKLLLIDASDIIKELAAMATNLKLTEFCQILINIQSTNDEKILNDEFYQYMQFIENIENIIKSEM
ncbi:MULTISPECIES: hypothetical protein [Campylobacter]|uniref:Uncharacterized protein n=1 Tax=Campylobacter porcelli TaxID=1660073 RepID=A0ABU7M4X9_9BACT|nr:MULTISPECIES: hypothetical protein [unclassified Campylobacter]MCR8679201.1 hypothetical protein [Campylobacter sp. RM19072]MCR8696707.1 hypothetical protein [Campylobacter sp. RM19073]MEE3744771.1 hypothetical protein [Campylobacter sp. CX2-4855-23]